MKDAATQGCVAIVGLTVLESVAMLTGNDGTLFLPVVAAVAGIGGFSIGKVKGKTKKAPEEIE